MVGKDFFSFSARYLNMHHLNSVIVFQVHIIIIVTAIFYVIFVNCKSPWQQYQYPVYNQFILQIFKQLDSIFGLTFSFPHFAPVRYRQQKLVSVYVFMMDKEKG